MSRKNRISHPLRVVATAGAIAAALTLASCSGTAAKGESDDGKLQVVATTTQLQDFASEVGGDDIDLTGLLVPGGSAHHFDPTPADLLALGKADVLIVNGAGLESFIDSAVEASGFKGEIVTASDGIDLAEAKEITAEGGGAAHDHEHEHAEDEHADHDHAAEETHADHDHAEEGHAEENHAEEGHDHDHDHGDVNPHIWTSPHNAEGMVDAVSDGLEKADPDHASDYRKRADAYIEKLGELDSWVHAQFERVPEADRVLVSGHDSLTYFLHDYGIRFAGSVLPSFEDNAEPSAADIDALVAKIKAEGVKAVFVESSMNPKLAQTIAKEAGIEVVDAESLYADSLGKPGTDAETYIGATVSNTRVIIEAWGVEPEALPAGLD